MRLTTPWLQAYMWTFETGNKFVIMSFLPNITFCYITGTFRALLDKPIPSGIRSWGQGFYFPQQHQSHVSVIHYSKEFFIWCKESKCWGQRRNEETAKRREYRVKYKLTLTAQQQQSTEEQSKGKVNLAHTSELLLLLFTHPVDSEAGGSSKTTPENLLVRLSPPVGQRTRFFCGTSFKLLNYICRHVCTKRLMFSSAGWSDLLVTGEGQELLLLRSFFKVLTATLR